MPGRHTSSRADNLRELSRDELERAGAADCDLDDEYLAALEELKKAADLEEELRKTQRELAHERHDRRMAQLASLIYENVIGTGINATSHPSEGLDLVVAHDMESLLANIKACINGSAFDDGPIAFIPVRIWPLAVQPSEDGKDSFGIKGHPTLNIEDRKSGCLLPNQELGRTRIQASYATAQVMVEGRAQYVSLSGFGRISINPFGGLDPDELATRLDRTANWSRWSNQSIAETVATPDGPREEDEGPPFNPSEQAEGSRIRFKQGEAERGRIQDRLGPNNQVD